MKRVKLVVAYDGTNYCGWQVQPNEITVEGVLNKHISELTGEDIKVIGATLSLVTIRLRTPSSFLCA